MQQIIYFFQKFRYFLFFLFLEFIALTFIFNNLNFHKSKLVNSTNTLTGGLFETLNNSANYFDLKSKNLSLSEENTRLRNLLAKKNTNSTIEDSVIIDTTSYNQKYAYINAKVINNNYTKAFNFLTINKGANQNISKEMAVINSKGIVGITEHVGNKYTRVQSILNKKSKINARLKNSGYFGTLSWNGENYKNVQLSDIPRQAPLNIGDTIETGGKSTIFPEGVLIGVVTNVGKKNTINNTIEVTLFNDMSNLNYVNVIKNFDKIEIQQIENNIDE